MARPWEPPTPGEHHPRVWLWRGRQTVGGAQRGPLTSASAGVTLLPGGTLHITNMSQADVDTYRCVAHSVASTQHSQEAQLPLSGKRGPGESAGTGQGAGCGASALGVAVATWPFAVHMLCRQTFGAGATWAARCWAWSAALGRPVPHGPEPTSW